MQLLYRLQIITLLVLNPAKFFQKLNRLDWYHHTLKQWVDSFQLIGEIDTQDQSILDIGCATGELSHYLSGRYRTTIGIDNSLSMIKKAKELKSNAHFQLGDATQLKFKDNQFDVVISASLVNIIPNPELLMAEMKRVCKENGLISVLVPLKHFDLHDLKQLKAELNLDGFSAAALTAWQNTPPKMDVSELIQLFNNIGLEKTSQSLYLNNMLIAVTAIKV